MKIKSTVFLAICLIALAPLVPGAPARRPITESDLLKLRWIADPQISPDGRQVAYVLVTVNEKDDGHDTSLWTVAAAERAVPRPLTSGPRDSAPRWSPDSGTLAFLRAGEKSPPQIHLLSMSGGEARKLTDIPKGASIPVWSPDGKTVAFTSSATADDLAEKKGPAAPGDKKKKSDVHVVTQAFYRLNGLGIFDPAEQDHIWTVAAEPGPDGPAAPKQITSGKYDEGSPVWSRDGARLYFVSDRVDESYYEPSDGNVYAAPKGGGPLETIVDIDGPILDVSPSPDGLRYAFHGWINPPAARSYDKVDFFVAEKGKVRNLTADFDGDFTNFIAYDTHPPRGGGDAEAIVWTADGSSLLAVATERGSSNLIRIAAATGQREKLTTGDHEIVAFSATPDASRVAMTIDDTTHPGELYLWDAATRGLTRLTAENDPLMSGLDVPKPEKIQWKSFDGKPIEGWLYFPPPF